MLLVVLMLLDLQFCIVLLLATCESIDEKFFNTLTAKVTTHQIEQLKKCADESKWLICNMYFTKCIYSTTINRWRYVPVCQETCRSFLNTKNCLPIMTLGYFAWDKIARVCPEIIEENDMINRSVYPYMNVNIT